MAELQIKRLWEIEDWYHCSIIGTCLTLKEVRINLKKSNIAMPPKCSDYQVHSIAVRLSKAENKFSRRLDGLLHRKFLPAIREFNGCKNAVELQSHFNACLKSKNIPGAYWALMSHTLVTREMEEAAFGEIHMLSHLNGYSKRADARKLYDLEVKCKRLIMEKNEYKKQLKTAAVPCRDVESENVSSDTIQLESTIRFLKERVRELKSGVDMHILREEHVKMRKLLEKEERKRNYILRKYEVLKELHEEEVKENSELKKQIKECRILQRFTQNSDPEKTFTSKEILNMLKEKEMLCGKCVLLVGGKPCQIPTCRNIISQTGARFMYHDGGVENSMQVLDNDLTKADIVICPINCVSHMACDKIKRVCKKLNKTIIYAKSSGITSILQELYEQVS